MRILLLAALALMASPAFAVLAPEYYEAARREAAAVIVVEVEGVRGLGIGPGFGDCEVRGRVAAVERGGSHTEGQSIVIDVPCSRPGARVPAGPVIWQNHDDLRASRWGRAFLTADGRLALHQYDILAVYP